MLESIIPDMNCGHCKSAIMRAIGETDSGADIRFNL